MKKGVVIDAFQRGLLSQVVQDKLLADVDAKLLRLESGEADESAGQKLNQADSARNGTIAKASDNGERKDGDEN